MGAADLNWNSFHMYDSIQALKRRGRVVVVPACTQQSKRYLPGGNAEGRRRRCLFSTRHAVRTKAANPGCDMSRRKPRTRMIIRTCIVFSTWHWQDLFTMWWAQVLSQRYDQRKALLLV